WNRVQMANQNRFGGTLHIRRNGRSNCHVHQLKSEQMPQHRQRDVARRLRMLDEPPPQLAAVPGLFTELLKHLGRYIASLQERQREVLTQFRIGSGLFEQIQRRAMDEVIESEGMVDAGLSQFLTDASSAVARHH